MHRRSLAAAVALATAVGSVAMVVQATAASAGTTHVEFAAGQTGSWTVPQGVSAVAVDLIGGSGGSTYNYQGGSGAELHAEFAVTPGETLNAHVAGNGTTTSSGVNGGGATGYPIANGAGGGASDIRVGGDDLASRILVAAGGGGAVQWEPGNGGDAEMAGGNHSADYCGRGGNYSAAAQPGTQDAGGAGGVTCGIYYNGESGSIGQGGAGANHVDSSSAGGGGGGGGYYGGGGGAEYGGGAGGSSFVDAGIVSSTLGLAPFGTAPSVRITWVTPPAATVQVAASYNSLPADGTATTTVTATIHDEYDNPTPGDLVSFTTNDPAISFDTVTDHGDGTYSAVYTSSTTAHDVTVTVTDGTASGTTIITQTSVAPPATITFTSMPPTPATVGGSYAVTTSGTGSSAPVVLSIAAASANVCSLTAAATVSFTGAGTCAIVADQAGDGSHASGHATQDVTVARRASGLAITVDNASAVYGQAIKSSATVRPHVEGTVQFALDGTPVGAPVTVQNGSATGPALTPGVGDHAISAAFTPANADTDASSNDSTDVVVAPAATSTGVAVTAQSLTATVAVPAPGSGSPTGTVAFRVDGTVVGSAAVVDGVAVLDHTIEAGAAHAVSARYSGDGNFLASSGSTVRHDPVIRAKIVSAAPRSAAGWYRTAVRVVFTCTTADAELSTACPKPVALRRNGAAQTVERTVRALDGGIDTVAVSVNIDRTAPSVVLHGVRSDARYVGHAPRATCTGRDSLSGTQRCTVATKRGRNGAVSYVATAVDKAGNRARLHGRFVVTDFGITGVPYVDGAYQVRAGQAVQLQYAGSTRPRYVNAAPAPRQPSGNGPSFRRMHGTSTATWALGVTITKSLRSHRYWNLGIKVGHTLQVVRIRVR